MLIFFFKQKTAYEMRISDWSSDVCSSDLVAEEGGRKERRRQRSAGGRRVVRRRKGSQHARQIIDREGVHIIAILGQVIIGIDAADQERSEEHTSELQSLMRISYAVFCLKKKKTNKESREKTAKVT